MSPQRAALIVVGAQAVMERTKNLTSVEPSTTYDADIGVEPSLLADRPLLGDLMAEAGFSPARDERPGVYRRGGDGPTVDLIVPEALAGPGRRGARLGEHGKRVAGRAQGLEMSVVCHDVMEIGPVRPIFGAETAEVRVASVGALLCAKAWKLSDRVGEASAAKRDRVRPKDAVDVWRLMSVSDPTAVRAEFAFGIAHPQLGETIASGQDRLISLFHPEGRGTQLALLGIQSQVTEQDALSTIESWMAGFNKPAH
ncbi:MAG: hypothetical protein ACRD0J_02845 [Acidimicrobiales bacterium]